MNAVIVDGDLSYPTTSGKRLRTLHLMLRMARRGHAITYVCRGRAAHPETSAAQRYLAEEGIETLVADDVICPKSGLKFYASLGANLLSPRPYSVDLHQSPKMAAVLQGLAATRSIDIWQFEWTPYANLLPWTSRFRKVVNAHNVDTLLWQRYYLTERNLWRRWYIKKQWDKMANYERRTLPRAARVVTCTEDDASLLRKEFRVERVDVVDNGIDRTSLEAVRRQPLAQRLLFLGSLEWLPNIDAVRLLLDDVFPRIRQSLPNATLCIAGRNPPSWLVQRAAAPGVRVCANVPDVRPLLEESTVMVVPLRSGGGSRLKILEALAAGLPVVTTRVGVEGLVVPEGAHLRVVESVEDFTPGVLQCLANEVEAQASAMANRQFILDHYDWDVQGAKLERAWETVMDGDYRVSGERCTPCALSS